MRRSTVYRLVALAGKIISLLLIFSITGALVDAQGVLLAMGSASWWWSVLLVTMVASAALLVMADEWDRLEKLERDRADIDRQ